MSPKRTLNELLLIYETEAALVDVYCEGPSDALIFRFFTESINYKTAIYSADQIEWPDQAGDVGGHRGKLVFLSNKLSSKNLNALCVIDKDLDTIQDMTADNINLCKSDFGCIDMYGLDPDDLSTFIFAKFNVAISAAQLSSVFGACKHLFAIRFLRDRHCSGATIPPADRLISDAKKLLFSTTDYLERCRQLNGYDPRWDAVIREQDQLVATMTGDYRDYINIHDLGDILVAIVRALKSKSLSLTSDFVAKHCSYVLLSQRNFGYPLFSHLSARLT